MERRDSLTNHDLRSRDDAIDLLDDLEASATPPPANSTGQQDNTTGRGTGSGSGSGNGGGANEGTSAGGSGNQAQRRATSDERRNN